MASRDKRKLDAMILFFSKEIKKARLVEFVGYTISDSLKLEIEFFLFITEVSVARNVYDLGFPGHHLLETLKVDGLLTNLEVFARTPQDLDESSVLKVGCQLVTACRH